jgi:hypothetical protein
VSAVLVPLGSSSSEFMSAVISMIWMKLNPGD